MCAPEPQRLSLPDANSHIALRVCCGSRDTMPIEFPGPRGISLAISPIETSVLLPLTFLCSSSNRQRCLRLTGSPRFTAIASVHKQYGRSPGKINPVLPHRHGGWFRTELRDTSPRSENTVILRVHIRPGSTAAGDARAPALHVSGDPTFCRHRISIRMNLVYATAKKTDGKTSNAAKFCQIRPTTSSDGSSDG